MIFYLDFDANPLFFLHHICWFLGRIAPYLIEGGNYLDKPPPPPERPPEREPNIPMLTEQEITQHDDIYGIIHGDETPEQKTAKREVQIALSDARAAVAAYDVLLQTISKNMIFDEYFWFSIEFVHIFDTFFSSSFLISIF